MSGQGTNCQIYAYGENRAPKEDESEMIELIREWSRGEGACSSVLDLGCADGMFLASVIEEFRPDVAHGVELGHGLAARTQQRIGNRGRVFAFQRRISIPAVNATTASLHQEC